MNTQPRIAALASGRGSNVEALYRATRRGDLHATVALVISNNSGCGALAFARDQGIPALHLSAKTHTNPGRALLERLVANRIDLVALAGYMKKLPAAVVQAFEGRAVNIHPAPLPRFGGQGMFGEHVHAAVLAAKVTEAGPTVHRVTAEYDEGETLGFTSVPVREGDTIASLAARVLAAEHGLYWRVIEERFVNRSC